MNEDKTREFDKFFKENYKYLLGFTKSINPKHEYEDTLHDCYLRARTRINESGYSGSTYLNYFRVALINYYKSNYRNAKTHQMINIEDPDYYGCVEEILLQKENQNQQEEEIQNRNIYLNEQIFEYLDKYYDEKDQFIFKTYYLLKHKHLNYKQLSQATNYSITAVSNTIKKIKKDLRYSLESYIINGINMEELLKEVENLVKNGGSWDQHKQMYKKIYGVDYQGCKCKANKLQDAIKNWYISKKDEQKSNT